MSKFKEQLEKAKNAANSKNMNRNGIIQKVLKHWKQLNEFYMLFIILVLWHLFPMVEGFFYQLIYPNSNTDFIGVTNPGILQNILLGLLIFFTANAAAWWSLKFNFPRAGAWLDDVFEKKAFAEGIVFSAVDRYRSKLLITMYLIIVAIAATCIITVMP